VQFSLNFQTFCASVWLNLHDWDVFAKQTRKGRQVVQFPKVLVLLYRRKFEVGRPCSTFSLCLQKASSHSVSYYHTAYFRVHMGNVFSRCRPNG